MSCDGLSAHFGGIVSSYAYQCNASGLGNYEPYRHAVMTRTLWSDECLMEHCPPTEHGNLHHYTYSFFVLQ
eukprot:scaffold516621_cov37-Prasinocladus_malaysianus.AAC.1